MTSDVSVLPIPSAASGAVPSVGEAVSDSPELRSKHAVAGRAMAAATFAMALTAGIQALLYLGTFGVDGRTDGFFAAFALYAIFGVFSQSIRITSVPLVVGAQPRVSWTAYAAALTLIGLLVVVATVPLAGLTVQVLAPGLDESSRAVTRDALPILGGAMALQLWAAGAATLLAVGDRFQAVARAYIAGAVGGLIGYLAVSGPAGELSLGWAMLVMATITFGLMLFALVRDGWDGRGRVPGPGRLLATTGLLLARTGIYLALNGLFLVTLALAGRYEVGDTTMLAYAYLYASYLVAGTGFALGMTRVSDMTRGTRSQWQAVLRDTVPQGFRYAMLLTAPALALLVSCGATLAGEMLPESLASGDVETLRRFAGLLTAWTVAALLVNLLLPVMFALGRARLVNALALPLLAVHVAVTVVAGVVWGVDGVVGAAFVAPFMFAGVMLAVEARGEGWFLTKLMAKDGLRCLALAAGAYGSATVLASTVTSGIAASLAAAVGGSILYAAGVLVLAPRQVRVLIRGPSGEDD